MKRFIKDTSGISYGIYAIAIFIVLAGSIVVWFLPVFNQFISIFNIFIAQGMVSQGTADVLTFITYVIEAMTIFILFGVAGWGIVRALEKKQQEG